MREIDIEREGGERDRKREREIERREREFVRNLTEKTLIIAKHTK